MTEAELEKKSQRLVAALDRVIEDLKPQFSRSEAGESAGAYLRALLSSVERKNTWQMAEVSGRKTPYAFQHLLGRSHWDCDTVRDKHVTRVREGLGTRGGVLCVDETGFLKKGEKSTGVARQYSGTAGRIENCQIGVFLSWKTQKGQTLLDRELYLPKEWTEDPDRCRAAGVPETRGFQTKPQLARQMIERVLSLGIQPAWVTADEAYGHDGKFRFWLEEIGQPYVVAVPSNQSITRGLEQLRVSGLLGRVKDENWIRLSAGAGSKGPRFYEWSGVPINHAYGKNWKRAVLFRRSLSDPKDIAFYLAFCPAKKASLEDFIRAAGSRWSIEECFESAKGEVGLDQYEVRSYTGWYRHMTLAMLAHALLATTRAKLFAPTSPKAGRSRLEPFKKKHLALSSALASRKFENS
jgi:SRSO17 transposase